MRAFDVNTEHALSIARTYKLGVEGLHVVVHQYGMVVELRDEFECEEDDEPNAVITMSAATVVGLMDVLRHEGPRIRGWLQNEKENEAEIRKEEEAKR